VPLANAAALEVASIEHLGVAASTLQDAATDAPVGVAVSPLSAATPLNAATPTLKMQMGVGDVTAFHTQLTHIFNPEVVKERNLSYDCHMKNRPPVLAEDRFDPTTSKAQLLQPLISWPTAQHWLQGWIRLQDQFIETYRQWRP